MGGGVRAEAPGPGLAVRSNCPGTPAMLVFVAPVPLLTEDTDIGSTAFIVCQLLVMFIPGGGGGGGGGGGIEAPL